MEKIPTQASLYCVWGGWCCKRKLSLAKEDLESQPPTCWVSVTNKVLCNG